MEEYIYEESKYIKRQDLKDFVDLMLRYDFMPDYIEDDTEFNIAFHYLVNLTKRAPLFLQPYEYALSMLELLEMDEDLKRLKSDLETQLVKACEEIAKRESVFDKQVLWDWQENRPLIRGFFNRATKLWKEGKLEEAHKLFTKILKTNQDDNIGARYSVKATKEKMPFDTFENRFVILDETGSYYRHEKLDNWFKN